MQSMNYNSDGFMSNLVSIIRCEIWKWQQLKRLDENIQYLHENFLYVDKKSIQMVPYNIMKNSFVLVCIIYYVQHTSNV